jgi:NO-binding membrane sensor protein with MHYT domain
MGIFDEGMIYLYEMGILDVIIPFILVFTIVFAVLQKTKILGADKDGRPRKNYNSVIALVMGLSVVIPHVIGLYPPDRDVVEIINRSLPNVSLVLVAVIALLLIIGVFGGEVNIAGSSLAGVAVLFAIVATIYIFGSAANIWEVPGWLSFINNPETQMLVVVILVFALIIWFITKDDKEKKPGDSFLDGLGKAMQRSGKQ